MFLEDRRIRDRAEVGVIDYLAVQRHLDLRSVGRNLFHIPLAGWFQILARGRDHVVYRPVPLRRLQPPLVFLVVVIEDLNLHAGIGDVARERRTDTNAIVSAWSELELETENEIIEFLLGKKVAPAIFGTN